MTASGLEQPAMDGLADLTRKLFRGARTQAPEKFQDWALEQLKGMLPFDSAQWVSGALLNNDLLFHSIRLHRKPIEALENYAKYRDQDFLRKMVMATPGKTVDPCDQIPRNEFEKLDIYRNHCRPFGMLHALSTAAIDKPNALFTGASIYRADIDKPFSAADKAIKQFITPILVEARNLNICLHLNEPGGLGASASAICDVKGMLREAESGFPELMRREWPEWRGPLLPVVPESVMDDGCEAMFHGGHVVMRLQRWNELVKLSIREKGAFDSLTPGEQQVAQRLTEGLTNKEIANALGISPKTVGNHLHRIFAKLGVPNRQRAIAMLKDEV